MVDSVYMYNYIMIKKTLKERIEEALRKEIIDSTSNS